MTARVRLPGAPRRALLHAGASAMLLPLLREARATDAPRRPRLVLLMQANGVSQANFWPRGSPATSPVLEPLLGDPALARRTTAIKGLFNRDGGAGNEHDFGWAGLFSGYRTIGTFNDPWGGGPSIDQVLRRAHRFSEPFPTLNCGVLANDSPVLKTHRRSFAYTGARAALPTETDPYRLYARVFQAGRAPGEAGLALARQRLREERSVLDSVHADLAMLARRADAHTRARLDAHATLLREHETSLARVLADEPGRPARCGEHSGAVGGLDPRREDDVPELMHLMLDFVALAIGCGLTRVVTFPLCHSGEKWYFRWLGLHENGHEGIAHRDTGADPVVTEKMVRIGRWFAEQVAYLARALDRLPGAESGGTALDETLLVWGNELATGPHGMDDIPVVLVGGAAGRLRHDGPLIDRGPQTYQRLGTSLLRLMGVPATGFGEHPSCGPLAGLTLV